MMALNTVSKVGFVTEHVVWYSMELHGYVSQTALPELYRAKYITVSVLLISRTSYIKYSQTKGNDVLDIL